MKIGLPTANIHKSNHVRFRSQGESVCATSLGRMTLETANRTELRFAELSDGDLKFDIAIDQVDAVRGQLEELGFTYDESPGGIRGNFVIVQFPKYSQATVTIYQGAKITAALNG